MSETESDSQSHSLTVADGDGHSTRCHRPPPDVIHATMYFMLLHRSVKLTFSLKLSITKYVWVTDIWHQ